MGNFITAEELQTKARLPELNAMEPDDLEFIYIDVAEQMIEVALNLNLNTSNQPEKWAGRMDATPRLEDEFRESYARAVFHVVERMASNPYRYTQQSVQGASATYSLNLVDDTVRTLMNKWTTGQRRIGRA